MNILAHTQQQHAGRFSAEWLALREPYDVRARNPAVLKALIDSLSGASSIRIADLACGTGSTLRALEPLLPIQQSWQLVDNDTGLLAHASTATRRAAVTVTTEAADLNHNLEAVFDNPVDLVTISALLDLVSDAWLERLARRLAAHSIPVYAALTYDGRVELDPVEELDGVVVCAVNAHQRSDKGFGPALGPAAANCAITRLETLGYSALQGTSDWEFGPNDRDIQFEILASWARAALDIQALSLADTITWLTRRREAVAAGHSSIRVGHTDFFAAPSDGAALMLNGIQSRSRRVDGLI